MNQLADHHPFVSRVRPEASVRSMCNGFTGYTTTNNSEGTNQGCPSGVPFANGGGNNADTFEQLFMKVLTRVNSTIELNERRIADQDYRERIKLEWQHVARIIDRILLTIFVAVTLTTTCAVMLQSG